jgi:hypothetical protein
VESGVMDRFKLRDKKQWYVRPAIASYILKRSDKKNLKGIQMNDNYALYILKNALRDEITYRQQACEVLDGNEPHHSAYKNASRDAFVESLKQADLRIPQLLNAIEKIEPLHTKD